MSRGDDEYPTWSQVLADLRKGDYKKEWQFDEGWKDLREGINRVIKDLGIITSSETDILDKFQILTPVPEGISVLK
ncbi:MAG: hypothetical protein ACTSQI_13800 [Candidatus Helarchaeota archaeon]